MQKNLKTKRLLLRAFTLKDVDDVINLAGDKEIAKTTLSIPHPYTRDDAIKWIKSHKIKYNEGTLLSYAITLINTKELIGCVALRIEKNNNIAELVYWIGKKYWNNGYCTEASKILIDTGFNELKLHKIYAAYFNINPASGKVMEKLGMNYEGCLKKHIKKWNNYYDLICYGILNKNR